MFLKILGNIVGWFVSLVALVSGVALMFLSLPGVGIVFVVAGLLLNPVALKRLPWGKTLFIKVLMSLGVTVAVAVVAFDISQGVDAYQIHQSDSKRVATAIDFMKTFDPKTLAKLKDSDRTIDNPAIEVAIIELMQKRDLLKKVSGWSDSSHDHDAEWIALGQKKCVAKVAPVTMDSISEELTKYYPVLDTITDKEKAKYMANAVNHGLFQAYAYMATLDPGPELDLIKPLLTDQDQNMTKLRWAMKEYSAASAPEERGRAAEDLAYLYAKGEGGATKDAQKHDRYDAEYVGYLLGAADKGDADAMKELSSRYYDGNGVPKDANKGFEFNKKAAESGNTDAWESVANIYDDRKDYANAAIWYEKAAAQCDHKALAQLGTYYDAGKGVSLDYAKAYALFSQDLGVSAALNNMGVMNEFGDGRPINLGLAKRQYCYASERYDASDQSKKNCARLKSLVS